jgi:hypothetical protein
MPAQGRGLHFVKTILLVLGGLAMLPAAAHAQAAIAGAVKDTSGAVLPGVTVEASSPALIEKVRSVVTDGTGQYRIVDLRPGTYAVTFMLTGFTTVKREGIELTGTFTASINVEMTVGTVAETITVSGETPIVDVTSVRRQTTLPGDLLTSAPTSRSWAALSAQIPAMTTAGGNNHDIQVTPAMIVYGGAGGRAGEGRLTVDGLNIGSTIGGGGSTTFIVDISNAAEVVTSNSGGLGEMEVGGPSLNVVPKTGGNSVNGNAYLSGVPPAWVGSNYSDALKSAGLSKPGALIKQWDFDTGVGGPVKRDKLWFFVTARDEGQWRTIPGIYPNLNAGDPTKFLYVPDTTRQVDGAESWQVGTIRLTLQATPRNKFNFYWNEQLPCNGATQSTSVSGCRQSTASAAIGPLGVGGLTGTTSPEIGGYLHTLGGRSQQFTWASPVTSRLLLDFGYGNMLARWGPEDQPGNPTLNLARVMEQCAAGCAANGGIPGLTYRSQNWMSNWAGVHNWRASVSHVTGAHSRKFGYIGNIFIDDEKSFGNSLNLTYRLNNGVPNGLTETALPTELHRRVRSDAFYAQEQWTLGRVTLQGALRFDHSWSYFPEQVFAASNYLPFTVAYPFTQGVTGYKDITPRVGVVYDVFGNGKTSLKVNAGKYLEATSNGVGFYSTLNPAQRLTTSSGVRAWNDINGNFIPDCDLLNMSPNGECGQGSVNFGKQVFTSTVDPAANGGWGVRPSDWGVVASVQQQVLPRVSMEVSYTRRWLNHFAVTDNTLVAPSDFGTFTIAAPSDPRLPGGGGYAISNLYNVNNNKFGQSFIDNTFSDYLPGSPLQYSHYNGVLLNVSARPRNGLLFTGGINAGNTVTDDCAVRALLNDLTVTGGVSPTNPYCHTALFTTRFNGLASYVIPKVDVSLGLTIRSDQGDPLAANWAAPNSVIAPALGRSLSGGQPNATINLVAPGAVWGNRVNEVDLRVGKILRFWRTRTNVGIDIFNLTNSAAILTYNQTFVPGGTWLAPLSVLTPRFVKLSAQIGF